jgi:hypothetical protein
VFCGHTPTFNSQRVTDASRLCHRVRLGVDDEAILGLSLVESVIIGNAARKPIEPF